MSPHQIAAAIEAEARAYGRLRFTDADTYLVTKDEHTRRVVELSRDLVRAIGTPELLSIAPGQRRIGGRAVRVELRTQVPVKAPATA